MKQFLIYLFATTILFGGAQTNRSLPISKTTEEITIDGILNEATWTNQIGTKDFIQKFPIDSGLSKTKTEVKVAYNEKYFYISAICYNTNNKEYIIQSLKRDFSFPVSDAFAVFINPTNDKINGFSFAVNPYNAQREGVLQRGGVFGVSTDWDNIWFSQTKRDSTKWTVEIAIPFKSIRYNEQNLTWGINFARNNLSINETSVWNSLPVNFNVANLSFAGELNWTTPPPKAGFNSSIIPYITANSAKNIENNTSENNINYGLDAKIALTSNLNLDATFLPDFSNVDVDAQQINLTQFSLFFPERRKFFTENADLFSQFGFSKIRPFYSRRIGQNSTVLGGARITGKLDDNWRIGIMNIQSGEVQRTRMDSTFTQQENYTVAALQRKVGQASDIGFILVNQTGTGNPGLNNINWNRIAGIEYNIANKKRTFIGELFYHHSFQPEEVKNSNTHASFLRWQQRNWSVMWNHEYVGEGYTATLGFVPYQTWWDQDNLRSINRTYWRLEPSADYRFYVNHKYLHNHGPGVYYSHYTDENFNATDIRFSYYYFFNFNKGNAFKLIADRNLKKVIYPFHIFNTENPPLEPGTYTFNEYKLEYTSSRFNKLYYGATLTTGDFYNGTKQTFRGNINYRWQPWGIFTANISYNVINHPSLAEASKPTLIGAQTQLSFTTLLYLTTYLQYNTQADNFNINARLQYRFKPMSDLFLVYTNNYDVLFNEKNRAIVLKFVYWFQS